MIQMLLEINNFSHFKIKGGQITAYEITVATQAFFSVSSTELIPHALREPQFRGRSHFTRVMHKLCFFGFKYFFVVKLIATIL